MKKKLILLLAIASIPFTDMSAQQPIQVAGKRTYSLGIMEMDSTSRRVFNRQYARHAKWYGSRGFMEALWVANRSAVVSKIVTTTEDILDAGVSRLTETIRNPRAKWEEAVKKESYFSQKIWTRKDIKDFYSTISTNGPLDPENIVFEGITCKEVFKDTAGVARNVFYVSCKLDTSELKLKRMVAHSKFEVYVDSVYFNPYICDLPNDSLQDVSKRIPFSFKNREDLHLKIHAEITSSWINEGAMIFMDQKLGEFDIDIKIDPKVVKENMTKEGIMDSVYTYKYDPKNKPEPGASGITVSGESFVVPRSYSGNTASLDGNVSGIWGTGQYKVNMIIVETCKIKKDHYMDKAEKNVTAKDGKGEKGKKDKNKWNDNWKSEWKLIQGRPNKDTFWNEAWTIIKTQWTGNEWLTELTSPTTSYLIEEGSKAINGGVSTKTALQMTGTSTQSTAVAGTVQTLPNGPMQQ